MNNIDEELKNLIEDMLMFHIPRWEELPDIELYMDQVITFIEKNIYVLFENSNKKIITPAMVNNYVKLKLIPKSNKKLYNKVHLAYLIAISILKQVLTIEEIRNGIIFQARTDGEKDAYNLFCNEQENALKFIASQINPTSTITLLDKKIDLDVLVVKMSTLAFASKIIAEKTIKIQKINIGGFQNE